MKKIIAICAAILAASILVACETVQADGTATDVRSTLFVGEKLAANQPTPSDIDYSLERYNLIKRAYWVNGQREKANTLVCAVEKPLGYIVLFTGAGAVVGSFVVDGKVSSLNSYLTPDSEVYEACGDYPDPTVEHGGTSDVDWLPDVDGSYGSNDNGIFFFTPEGKYLEWTGTYLYSDIPFVVDDPVVKIGG